MKACAAHGIDIPSPTGTFEEMYQCHADSDGITADEFATMDEDELSAVIRLGSGNCYLAESIYGWYKANLVKGNPTTTDPMNPSYTLTEKDIELIEAYMKEQDPKYTRPGKKEHAKPPAGYRVEMHQDWNYHEGIHSLQLFRPDGTRVNIGSVPMRHDDDGDGANSYAVYLLILELWNRGILFMDNDPTRLTGFDLLDNTRQVAARTLWYDNLPAPIAYHALLPDGYPQPYNNPEAHAAMTQNLLRLQEQLETRLTEND